MLDPKMDPKIDTLTRAWVNEFDPQLGFPIAYIVESEKDFDFNSYTHTRKDHALP